MQNKLIVLLSALILTACAAPLPVIQTVTQRVEIPIPVPCKVAIPEKPEFNFDKLTEENNIFEKVKAVLADRKLREAYETELNAALKSCTSD